MHKQLVGKYGSMRKIKLFILILSSSCYKPAAVETSGPIRLSADVKYFWPNGGFPYWYTMIDFSRRLPARTVVTVNWDRVGENGQLIKKESYVATIRANQPNPAVEKTAVSAQRTEKAENVRITRVVSDDPGLQFSY
jgi:predicted DNA-binding WGR domain protein